MDEKSIQKVIEIEMSKRYGSKWLRKPQKYQNPTSAEARPGTSGSNPAAGERVGRGETNQLLRI